MTGKRLQVAAETVFKAGQQLNKMMERLNEMACDGLEKAGLITDPEEIEDDGLIGDEDWIYKSTISNLPIYPSSRHKKTSSWLAFQMTIYDEDDIAMFIDWEPVLYVLYGPGGNEDYFEVGPLADIFTEHRNGPLNGAHVVNFKADTDSKKSDHWFFALPLTALGNEELLKSYVIEPAIKLIKNGIDNVDENQVFTGIPAFRYREEDEKIRIVR